MNNKVTIEINNNEVSTRDFSSLVTLLSEARMKKNFDIELRIPKQGFKVTGDWIFLSPLAQSYYKHFIKNKTINNIRVLNKISNT